MQNLGGKQSVLWVIGKYRMQRYQTTKQGKLSLREKTSTLAQHFVTD